MPKKIISKYVLAVIFSLLIFFAGFYIGGVMLNNQMPAPEYKQVVQKCEKVEEKKGSYEDGYQAGLDFARKRLIEEGFATSVFETNSIGLSNSSANTNKLDVLYSINAKVKSVKTDSIEIEFNASQFDILQNGVIKKTVKIPNDVKIEKHVKKDDNIFNKEMMEYDKQVSDLIKRTSSEAATEVVSIQSPDPYNIEYLSFKDLAEGDVLFITSDTNIKENDTFNAVSITLVESEEIELSSANVQE